MRTEFAENIAGEVRGARPFGIPGITDDADKTVFGQWAGCPSRPVIRQEKILGAIMMFMVGIGNGNEHIYVEEKHGGRPDQMPSRSMIS